VSKLPRVSGREVVRAFARIGCGLDRQRGSHIVLRHRDAPHRRLVVHDHREIAKGTLRKLAKLAWPSTSSRN
jgi:predicted RNA binding protein YcfA (HicA-like mRNA interferase family)